MVKNIIAFFVASMTMFIGICWTGWLAVEYDFSYSAQAFELVWWVLLSIAVFCLQRKTIEIGGLTD